MAESSDIGGAFYFSLSLVNNSLSILILVIEKQSNKQNFSVSSNWTLKKLLLGFILDSLSKGG